MYRVPILKYSTYYVAFRPDLQSNFAIQCRNNGELQTNYYFIC